MNLRVMITSISILSCLLGGAALAQEPQVIIVEQTDIKRIAGEVVNVRGNLMTLRHDDGSGRSSYRIPRGASISIAGTDTRLQDLQPGQRIRIYYRETSTGRVIVISPPQETETVVAIDESVPQEAQPEPVEAAIVMPTTASRLPLIGGTGLLLIGLGWLIASARRTRVRA